jgi:hypothetical protein
LSIRDSLSTRRPGNQKLTPQDVDTIRARLSAGETGTSIARTYGVDPKTISDIKTGKRHAGGVR